MDRSQLRYYTPPTRLNLDLGVGFSAFVPTKKNVPSKGLQPILRWIGSNGDSFRPKVHPKSPDKNGEVANGSSSSGLQRPDNLLTNFVSWRGMLTKLLCSPYNKQEPWKMAVTLYNGTIYFSEIETEESRARTARETPREQQMCYWGMKFEDYMTSSGWLLISSMRYSTYLVDFWTGGTSSNTSYFRYLSFQRSMPQSCKRCTHCP